MKTSLLKIHALAFALVCVGVLNVQAYFDAHIGRWASRDPIGERGGVNVYSFVANDPVNDFDLYGLASGGNPLQDCKICCCCVDGLTIGAGTIYQNTRMGHTFDVTAALSYKPYASKPSGCSLEWKEKTNVPAFPGVPADQWTDMAAMFPTAQTFGPWNNKKQPCPGSENVTITDVPGLGIPLFRGAGILGIARHLSAGQLRAGEKESLVGATEVGSRFAVPMGLVQGQ